MKKGSLLSLISKSSGRNYIIKNGCSMFRLTMTEVISGRIVPGTLMLTSEMAEKAEFTEAGQGAGDLLQKSGRHADISKMYCQIILTGDAMEYIDRKWNPVCRKKKLNIRFFSLNHIWDQMHKARGYWFLKWTGFC